MKPRLRIATLALIAAASSAHSGTRFYRLQSAVRFAGPVTGWDYLAFDPARSYLVMDRRALGVTVYDVKTHKVVGSIADSKGANSTTLVPSLDRGFTSNGNGSTTDKLTVRPVIDLAETRHSAGYQPSPTLADQIQLRDRTCVFPWCNRPARGCDKDHIVPWDSAWRITQLTSGKVRSVRASSGHIAGISNPPGGKRSYWILEEDTSAPIRSSSAARSRSAAA